MRYLTDKDNCPLCNKRIQRVIDPEGQNIHIYECLVCGNVKITDEALSILDPDYKHIISGITRNNTIKSKYPIEITSGNIMSLISQANIPRTVSEKLNYIITFVSERSDYPGAGLLFEPFKDYPIAYCKNETEFIYYLNQLRSQGLAEDSEEWYVILTPKAWSMLDTIIKSKVRSHQCFVAMWFNEELETLYTEGIEKAIIDAGFLPLRVDKLEHNNKICDAIISEIRRSAFLIADFTGHRGGVYFEAGFAMGLNIPVIWLCREDDINKAHFDTRQYNHILWSEPSELYTKLLNRINATILKKGDNGS